LEEKTRVDASKIERDESVCVLSEMAIGGFSCEKEREGLGSCFFYFSFLIYKLAWMDFSGFGHGHWIFLVVVIVGAAAAAAAAAA
jgi:hypothetical protein